MRTLLLSGIAALAFAGGAAAHPGHGGGGPPSTVTMGPPSAAFDHVPNGNADPDVAAGANLLGNLNAAHASSTALMHASPKSIVGAIAAYKLSVSNAEAQLAIDKQTLQTDMANNAPQNVINADNQAIANDKALIQAAVNTLALRANKPLAPAVVAQLNTLLGL